MKKPYIMMEDEDEELIEAEAGAEYAAAIMTADAAAHDVTVAGEEAGQRLDKFLSGRIETLSRARLQDLIRGGCVFREGKACQDLSAKVRVGEVYHVELPKAAPSHMQGEDIALSVVYEDKSLIVIDKPAGLVVHPGAGNPAGTLVNALIAHCGESLSGIGGVQRPGIVHRLDKDTSGLMVVAKTDEAHQDLAEQFADHGREGDLLREYLAVVWGEPVPPAGRIETQIARHSTNRVKMAVVKRGGKTAITHYQTEELYRASDTGKAMASLVRCRLETGRTHQVRVHMAYLGTPIISDPVYAAGFQTKTAGMPDHLRACVVVLMRQALHAAVLSFRHPTSGKLHKFVSPLPKDITNLCMALGEFKGKMSKI